MSNSLSCTGVGLFLQEEFAVRKSGECAQRLGKKALIVGGKTALSVAAKDLTASLDEAGIAWELSEFNGFCSPTQAEKHAAHYRACGADFVIGVGGGRAIDTSKGVAFLTDAPILLLPTSVATCASFATLIILYNDAGDPLPESWYLKRAIDVLLIDTDLIGRKCPVRMLSAGIADSLAKYVEIIHLRKRVPKWTSDMLAEYSWQMAQNIWNVQMRVGEKACRDAEQGILSDEVEEAIFACLILTGYASIWTCKGTATSVAHTIYYSMCNDSKEQQNRFLHGEMVSTGLPVQLMINGSPQAEIDELIRFLRGIKAPVLPEDLDLEPTEELCETILACCDKKLTFMPEEDKKTTRECLFKAWLSQ